MVLVRTPSPQPSPPPPPHAKACVSRNCDTNARIKFIIDTAIDDLEWKNPIDFGANRKKQLLAICHHFSPFFPLFSTFSNCWPLFPTVSHC